MVVDYFIYQQDKNACGPTSLKILAAHFFNDPAYLTIKEQWQTPSSFLSLVNAAATFQCVLKGYRLVRIALLKKIRSVMIVHIEHPHQHIVVVKRWFLFFWKIYDPGLGIHLVTFSYFRKRKVTSILLPSKKESMKAKSFRYFHITSIHPLFYWMTAAFALTMFFAILIFPSAFFMTSMMVFFACFALIWMIYLFHQLSRDHQSMDQTYGHFINNKEDFHRYHRIKAEYYSLPLKYMYYSLSLLMIGVYFSFIHIILVPFLCISTVVAVVLIYPVDQYMLALLSKIEKVEATLSYPLKKSVLLSITQFNYRYVLTLIFRYVLLILIGVIVVYIATLLTHINGTQWLLTLSLFLTTYQHTIHLRSLPRLKYQVYTMMNAFINKANMIK